MSGYKPATTSSRYTPAPRYQHMASRSAGRPAYQSRVGPPTTSRSLYSPARSRSPASGARLTATYIRPGTTSSSRSSAASGASTYAGAGGTSSGASSGAALRSNSYARLPSTSSRIGRTGSAEAVARLSRSSSSSGAAAAARLASQFGGGTQSRGAVPDRKGERLRDAAVRGDAAAVATQLNAGTDGNTTDAHGDTALHKAAQYGHVLVVTELVGMGVRLDLHGWDGRTALHDAALYGHEGCVEELLAAGANPRLVDKPGRTPVECAAQKHHPSVVKTFEDYMAVIGEARTQGAAVSLPPAARSGSPQSTTSVLSHRKNSYPPAEWAARCGTWPSLCSAAARSFFMFPHFHV